MQRVALMFVMRGVLLSLILFSWNLHTALMYAPVFLATLFLPWLGREDHRLYLLDAYVMLVFSAALAAGAFGFAGTYGSVLGLDKLFHVLGGLGAAWCAFLLFDRHVRTRWARTLVILLAALAVGAAWEVFEFTLWLLPGPFSLFNDGYADTMMDLVADALGALTFVAVQKLFKRR